MNLKKNMSFFNKIKFVTFYHNKKNFIKKMIFFGIYCLAFFLDLDIFDFLINVHFLYF